MGEFFQAKRSEKGWSLSDLSQKTGYSEYELGEIEKSEDLYASILTVLTIGEALEIPKIELLLMNGTINEEDIVTHALKNEGKFNTDHLRKKELEQFLSNFSEKEKEILDNVISPIYFSDSSDYLTGLWGVVRVLFEGISEIKNDDIKKIYHILHPEENE
jgi:transcriptional regulator with XRE-family HTH domain